MSNHLFIFHRLITSDIKGTIKKGQVRPDYIIQSLVDESCRDKTVDDEMSCNMIGATFGQQNSLAYAILKLRIYEKLIVRASYSKCRILTQNFYERNKYVTKPYFAGLIATKA